MHVWVFVNMRYIDEQKNNLSYFFIWPPCTITLCTMRKQNHQILAFNLHAPYVYEEIFSLVYQMRSFNCDFHFFTFQRKKTDKVNVLNITYPHYIGNYFSIYLQGSSSSNDLFTSKHRLICMHSCWNIGVCMFCIFKAWMTSHQSVHLLIRFGFKHMIVNKFDIRHS